MSAINVIIVFVKKLRNVLHNRNNGGIFKDQASSSIEKHKTQLAPPFKQMPDNIIIHVQSGQEWMQGASIGRKKHARLGIQSGLVNAAVLCRLI